MSDLDWVETMMERPPTCLSELEWYVGRLDVDFVGDEGNGSVMRPDIERPGFRAGLRPGVDRVLASFYFDRNYEDPHRPRDMKLRAFTLELNAPRDELARRLEQRFGIGRAVMHEGLVCVEHGEWFYLDAVPGGRARLAWQRVRSALPASATTIRAELLATLVDRLVCEVTVPPIVSALEPFAAAGGIEVHSPALYGAPGARGLGISFRCSLPILEVVAAFRWEQPVASVGDHNTDSAVGPLAAALAPPWAPVLGRWMIDVRIHGWPRGPDGVALPMYERGGMSPVYDIRSCQNTVNTIAIMPVDPGRDPG